MYYHGRTKLLFGLIFLSPVLILYALKIISNNKAKEILLQWFFSKEPIERFNQVCMAFAKESIPKMLRQEAIERLLFHKKNHDTVVVVTASAENWVKPWCDNMGILCLGTRLQVMENKLTGKYAGKNCYGPEKATRIKAQFDLAKFETIIAYGDSRGDQEMFGLANKFYYKTFPPT